MPRAGIGAVSVTPLIVLERLGLIPGVGAQIDAAVDQLRTAGPASWSARTMPAAVLARHIRRTMPFVYGGRSAGRGGGVALEGSVQREPEGARLGRTGCPS